MKKTINIFTAGRMPAVRIAAILAAAGAVLFCASTSYAQESLCATVEIEIRQTLTQERQAFDARMKINNGLDGIPLEDVSVSIFITDEEGASIGTASVTNLSSNTDALFFIQDPTLSGGITSLPGTIDGGTSAEMSWLLIPAVGAADDNPQGTMYYVGATLTYTLQGETETVEVSPDYIFVKPMPYLELDYFLPGYVYGDNGFTPNEIEPAIPFPLGLRIRNAGFGAAKSVQIDSGQPEIVTNELGLLVGFALEGSSMNGAACTPSLLMDFGDFESMESKMGYWEMTSSLAGLFTNFTADISHSDELGGQVTSLVSETNVNTHIHIKDVVVDLPGRDRVVDFLTANMVYESEGDDVSATKLGGTLPDSLPTSTFAFSAVNLTNGYVYATIDSPFGANTENLAIKQVVRSDGKVMHESNVWFSKEGPPHVTDGNWHHYFNLFDVNGSEYTYMVELMDVSEVNDPPVIQYIAPKTVNPGDNVGFVVVASDDGGVPQLSCGNLPSGATFVQDTNSTDLARAEFFWTPAENQSGMEYQVKFTASDGELSSFRYAMLTVTGDPIVENDYPNWWLDRGIIDLNATTNDFAAVNQGQLKHVATMAWDEFNLLPGGADIPVLDFTNANNYAVVNIGQIKVVAAPFYDRLGMTNNYPWSGSSNDASDYAIANIGQVKHVFSFEPLKDSDTDGMPDWWESSYTNSATAMDPNGNPDGDEHSNLYEYLHETNPNVPD